MDDLFVDKLLSKHGVSGARKKSWMRLFRWIKTFILLETHTEEILEWDGDKVKIFTPVSKDIFIFYLNYSLVFLAQAKNKRGLMLGDFCEKNSLDFSGVDCIQDVVKYCNELYSYGRL